MSTHPEPLALDGLLTEDERRPLTVEQHAAWRESISTPQAFDEVDLEIDRINVVDPFVSGTNNRRSDRELSRMLDLIDNLPISDSGKDGQA
jgi:hypothetical protein